MPLQIGQLLSDDPEKKKQQQQGLVGAAGGQLPGSPVGETTGAGFEGFFPSLNVGPVQEAPPIRDTSGLLFNPEFAARNEGLARQETDLDLYRDTNLQAVDQDYERQVGRANTMQQQARKRLMERMSGQGILQSGIHGQQQGELNTAHQGYLDDLGMLRASGRGGVETDYATRMNQIGTTREGLYGEQQQVEEQRRVEAARIEAENAQQAAEEARQAEILEALNRPQPQQQAMPQAQSYSAPAVQAPSVQAPSSGYTQRQPNWQAQAANFDDVVNWANNMRSNYGNHNRQAFNADVTRLLQTDPNFAGSMMNSMGQNYGGAANTQDVLNWLWFPQAPLLNRGIQDRQSQQYANMGVM